MIDTGADNNVIVDTLLCRVGTCNNLTLRPANVSELLRYSIVEMTLLYASPIHTHTILLFRVKTISVFLLHANDDEHVSLSFSSHDHLSGLLPLFFYF